MHIGVMFVVTFICLFFPSALGLLLYLKLQNKEASVLHCSLYYITNIVMTTITTMVICYYGFHITGNIEYELSISIPIAVKYMSVATVFSLVWALIFSVIDKNLEMKLVVKKNEKKK